MQPQPEQICHDIYICIRIYTPRDQYLPVAFWEVMAVLPLWSLVHYLSTGQSCASMPLQTRHLCKSPGFKP